MNYPLAMSASLPLLNIRPRWLILDGQLGKRNPKVKQLQHVAAQSCPCLYLVSFLHFCWALRWKSGDKYYSTRRVYLSQMRCLSIHGRALLCCLCSAVQWKSAVCRQLFLRSGEQMLVSFLSDFLRVNNRYWPYRIAVVHCELCMKCNFPVCCGHVWLCCLQHSSWEGLQCSQRHS